MPKHQNDAPYSPLTISLHWIIAALFVVAFVLGQVLEEMPRGAEKLSVLGWHLLAGSAILALFLPRLLARRANRPRHEDTPEWEKRAARLVHFALYALMIALPVSGFLAAASMPVAIPLPGGAEIGPLFSSPMLHEAGEEIHETLVGLLVFGVAIHVGGTLWHKFIRRDGVAGRMLPFARHRHSH